MTIDIFLKNFGIKIKKRHFYDEALTHNSYSNEKHLPYTYQRMEFLGDALIQKYVSLYLFQAHPNLAEGDLTKRRSKAVREETLAMVARTLNLGQLIRLGQGELNSHGYDKDKILADIFESLTAAIYLDHDGKTVKQWLEKTLFKFINEPNFKRKTYDYKSELQELLQADKQHDLKYILEKTQFLAEENRTDYTMAIYLDNQKLGQGNGFSKAQAEQEAAKDCLSKMKKFHH